MAPPLSPQLRPRAHTCSDIEGLAKTRQPQGKHVSITRGVALALGALLFLAVSLSSGSLSLCAQAPTLAPAFAPMPSQLTFPQGSGLSNQTHRDAAPVAEPPHPASQPPAASGGQPPLRAAVPFGEPRRQPSRWPPLFRIAGSRPNATAAEDRGVADLKLLGVSATRVAALTAHDVPSMLKSGRVVVAAGGSLADEATVAQMTKGQFTYADAAATLTHLNAIREAYAGGAEYALVFEDDVELFKELPEQLGELISTLPSDWGVIGLCERNLQAARQFALIRDLTVRWHREYVSGTAYAISRRAMHDILARHAPAADSVVQLPRSPAPRWFLFTSVSAFVSTRFGAAPVQDSALPRDAALRRLALLHRSRFAPPVPPDWPPAQSGSLADTEDAVAGQPAPSDQEAGANRGLVLTTIGGEVDVAGLQRAVRLTRRNALALREFPFDWCVFVVLIPGHGPPQALWEKEFGLDAGGDELNALRGTFAVVYRFWRKQAPQFSKWHFYGEVVSDLPRYNYVMLHDNDMEFTGFPWHEFFQRHSVHDGRALVTGAVRRSVWPELFPMKVPRDSFFSYLSGRWWHECGRERQLEAKVELVEQWFAYIDSGLMQTVFSHVLEPIRLHHLKDGYTNSTRPDLFSSWGPDAVWCELASLHGGYCLVLPLTMRHMDWRALTSHPDLRNLGDSVIATYEKLFPRWYVLNRIADVWGGKKCKEWRASCDNGSEENDKFYLGRSAGWLPACAVALRPDGGSH